MRPQTWTTRLTSLFASCGLLFSYAVVAHPAGRPAAAFAAGQQTSRLSFEAEFPAASVGRPYVQSVNASGGAGGYKFAEGGTLPPGMQWVPADNGLLLRGTPTQAGEYSLRILVNDISGQQVTRDVTFKVTPYDNHAPLPVNVNETLNTADAVNVVVPLVVNVNETLSTTDSVNVLLPLVVNVNETLTTTDAVNVVGEATTSASLTPSSQDFGSAAVGFFSPSSQQTFTLTNTGQTVLTSTAVTVTGTNVSSFQLAGNGCMASLAVDSNCSIYVLFEPAATGPLTAKLNVISTGSTGTVTQTSSLTGTGLPGPTLTVMPNPVRFPSTAVNTTSAAVTVTLTNTGNAQLTLNGTQPGTLSGADAAYFTFFAGNCGYRGLAVSASCSGSLTFKPNAARTFNATLSIPSNDINSPAVIPLTGTGAAAQATITPNPYSFGTVALNSTATNNFTVTNTGNLALSFASPQVAAPYSIAANTCASSLAVSATCTVSVAFTPTIAGTANGTLSLTDTSGDNFTVSLTGTGSQSTTPPAITVPANVTAEATSASGAAVIYTATATDATGGAITPVCAPASGSTFALGATTVTCTATDSHNNQSSKSFTVTVQDTTPPVITVPQNLTLAATSASGAVATYTASATDSVDGTVSVSCTPASGSTFALGTTTVNCSAMDSHSNQSHASFTVTVQDTTPPVITVSPNITAAATSASGAVVTYTATAVDLVGASVPVLCVPASGSTFALGTTTVNCSATDSHSNQAHASFTVTVQATTPPVITVPSNITMAATSANGAVVTYAVTAVDAVDGNLTPSCAPASGSTFVLGTTTVTCTATDLHGNQSSKSFNVTVQNTTPPVITVPANITAAATSANGAVVDYTATATDAVDGTISVTCMPPSGSTFAIGTTTVTCTATDSHNNKSQAPFTVNVQGPTYVFVANGGGSVSSLYDISGSVQTSGVAGGGIGAAVDRNGLVFSLTPDGTGVSIFYDNGTLEATEPSGLTGASALAIDGGDQLWIAAPSSVSIGQILAPNNQASYADPTLQKPSGVAIDLSGNVWISDSQSNTVHEIVGGGLPTQPLATAVKNQTPGTEPQ